MHGEQLACDYLTDHHYQIVERNFRCKMGEIDIIAKKHEYVVFCEVKTRSGEHMLHPSLSVTQTKRKRLRKLGEYYLISKKIKNIQPRFDVIAISLVSSEAKIEHLENAF